jgi:Uma2 family endonuclease
MAAIPLEDEIYYPDSDGEPLAETQLHFEEIVYLVEALQERFRETPDVFVAGDLLFYYQKGRRDAVVAPDVFMVRGISKELRRKYLLWEEREVPCFVTEVTSDSTRRKDVSIKKDLYQDLGVQEYFLFDPYGDYLDPSLQGFRLVDGRYRPVRADSRGALVSATTGISFRADGNRLRLKDAATGTPLLRREETTDALRRETAARRALEEEVARLRRELGR